MRVFGWFLAMFAMLLSASAALADSTQEVVNKAPNGLALTPPMGWNSWNKFGCNINEQIVRDSADAIVASVQKTGRLVTVRTLGGHRRYRQDDVLALQRWLERRGAGAAA